MTNYYKKRKKSGLERSEVANMLGIDYARYESIEKGEVKMPRNLMDKFNEIVNKPKGENKIHQLNRQQIVEQWWEEIISDKEKLNEKMKEFNIVTYKELANLLGYKTGATLSTYINGSLPCNYNFKNRLYSFFENELNIQPKKNNNSKRIYIRTKEEEELIQWYRDFDFNQWLKENNISRKEVSLELGIPRTTISYYISGRETLTPTIKNIKKVKEYINRHFKETTNIVENSDEDVEVNEGQLQYEFKQDNEFKNKIIDKYKNKIQLLNKEEITTLESIELLKSRLNKIHTEVAIYDQFIKEIEEIYNGESYIDTIAS